MGNNCCSESGKTELSTLEGNDDDEVGGKPVQDFNNDNVSIFSKNDAEEILYAYTSADKSKIVKI